MLHYRTPDRLGKYVLGGLIAVGLVACGGGDDNKSAIDGSVAAGPANIEQMLGFLPEGINVTFEDETYNKGSGTTTLTDMKVTFGDIDDRGLSIDELVIAGFDGDFLQARIDSKNFDKSAVIVDFLEARNVSLFGMEQFYEKATEAYLDTVSDLTEEALGEDIPDIEQSIDKLEYVIENIVIDDLELLPFEVFTTVAAADSEDDYRLAVLQLFASFSRAVGAKEMSMTGLSTVMDMTQDGQSMSMDMKMPKVGIEGWRGGDYQRSYAEGLTFDMSMPLPEEDDVPFEKMEISGGIASYSIENVRLDKAMSWLARGEMPPTTETDLMSFGVWEMTDLSFTMLDAPFYSLESSVTDMSEFHWLIPTKMTNKTENLVYDMGSLFEMISQIVPEDEDAPDMALVLKALGLMKDYDLSAPSMDFDFLWEWDEGAGPAKTHVETGLDGYGTFAFDFSGELGQFDEWVTLTKEVEDGASEEDFFAYLGQNLSFEGASIRMQDRGGNDRLFDFTIALADLLKGDVPELAAIAAYDKDTLKLLVSSSIKGGAEFGAAELPEIRDYAAALADYATEGGSFTIALSPETAVRMKTLRKLSDIDNPQEAKEFLDQLGFSISHQSD